MSMTVSVRLEGARPSSVDALRRHDLRIGKQPDYIDQLKTELNSVVIEPRCKSDILFLCESRRIDNGSKRKMKSSSSLTKSGVITFGTRAGELMKQLDYLEQNKLFLKAAKNIAKKCGVELIGLVVHRDESALHAHFQMPNVGSDGVPISKKRISYSGLQDLIAEPFSQHGITRGKKRSLRISDGEPVHKYVNRSVRRLHADLPLEIEVMELELRNLTLELRLTRETVLLVEMEVLKMRNAFAEEKKAMNKINVINRLLNSDDKEVKRGISFAIKAGRKLECERNCSGMNPF